MTDETLRMRQIIADHIEASVQDKLFDKWESEMEGEDLDE